MKYYFFSFFIITIFLSCNSEKKFESKKNKNNLNDTSTNKTNLVNGQTLFKDYKFGQTMDEIKKSGNYEDCTSFFETPALCIQNVKFLDNDYTAGLLFEDNILKSVCLYTDFSEEIYQSLPASLVKNNFQLVLLQDNNEKIDVLQSGKKLNKQNFLNTITEFENRMLSGNDALIAFMETTGVKKQIDQYGSSLELISDLPSTARELDLNIITDDDGKRYLALSFTLVKNSLETIGKKEKF